MKKFAAKLFLLVMAVAALSAAAMAETAGSSAGAVVRSAQGKGKCYIEWTDAASKKKIRLRIQCPRYQN